MDIINGGKEDKKKSVQTAYEEAQAEVAKEKLLANKEKLKKKLKEIDAAKTIVSNLEREIEDLMVQMADA